MPVDKMMYTQLNDMLEVPACFTFSFIFVFSLVPESHNNIELFALIQKTCMKSQKLLCMTIRTIELMLDGIDISVHGKKDKPARQSPEERVYFQFSSG